MLNAKSSITFSDAFFYRNIMKKHTKRKMNVFNFPMMIFSKNFRIFNQKIDINIRMDFSFNKLDRLFNLIDKKSGSFRNLLSCFIIEKFIPLFRMKTNLLLRALNLHKNINLTQNELISLLFADMYNSVLQKTNVLRHGFNTIEKSVFSISAVLSSMNTENLLCSFNPAQLSYFQSNYFINSNMKNFHASKFPFQNVSYPRTIENVIKQEKRTMNDFIFDQAIVTSRIFREEKEYHRKNVLNSLHAGKKGYTWQFQSWLNQKQFQSWINPGQFSIIQPYGFKKTSEVRNTSFLLEDGFDQSLKSKSNINFEIENNNELVFQDNQHIENEIDHLKNIVLDTKESLERTMSDNFTSVKNLEKKININNLSDRVYNNIERKIGIERERRGI